MDSGKQSGGGPIGSFRTCVSDSACRPDNTIAFSPAVAGSAAPAATADAAAPAAPPATISLGQTIDEVTAILGPPKSIVDLGPKKIYVYKDMKVTFNSGKVVDVQ